MGRSSGSPPPDNPSATDSLPNPPASTAAVNKDGRRNALQRGQTLRARNNWPPARSVSLNPAPGCCRSAVLSIGHVPFSSATTGGRRPQSAVPKETSRHKLHL